MPMFDGTGPGGNGPGTGRGMGNCQPDIVIERRVQTGRGMGRGQGFCRNNASLNTPQYAPIRPNELQEKIAIQRKIESLQAQKSRIDEEIANLEKKLNQNG